MWFKQTDTKKLSMLLAEVDEQEKKNFFLRVKLAQKQSQREIGTEKKYEREPSKVTWIFRRLRVFVSFRFAF